GAKREAVPERATRWAEHSQRQSPARLHPIEGSNSKVSAGCTSTTAASKPAPRSCRRDHQVRSLATAMADAAKVAATKTPTAINIFAGSTSLKTFLRQGGARN